MSSKRITFEMWDGFHVFLATDRKISEKSSSLFANKSRFKKLATYFTNRDFNRTTFNEFIGTLVAKKYTPSYINNFIKLAKNLDRYLKLNEVLDYSYFRESKGLPKDVLTIEEIEALANVHIAYKKNCEYINQRQRCIILLLGMTGMRIGELLGLQWDDIRTTAQFAYLILRDTKNGDTRQVPIGKLMHASLLALPRKSEYIFSSGRGGALECQQVNIDLKARAEAVGLRKTVYCHLFRHSFVTQLLQSGMELSDVSVIVGHRDPKVTMRYKNSALDHYFNALVLTHPLLRSEMDFSMMSEGIKQAVNNIVDVREYLLQIDESGSQLTITIGRKS